MAFDDRKATELVIETVNEIEKAMPSAKVYQLIKNKARDLMARINTAELKATRARINADMVGFRDAINEYKSLWLDGIKQFTA